MFKKGDKVRCIDSKGLPFNDKLTEGRVYEALEDQDDVVIRVAFDGGGVFCPYARRFELVEDATNLVATPDTKATNPKDGAATCRLDLSLVPTTAIAHEALAFTEGHLKYGGYNWRDAGVLASVYYSALMRHVMKWWNGEERDPATGVHHLGNARACLAVLLDAMECGELKDDRPPAVDMAKLLKEMEEDVKHLQEKFPNGPKRHTEAAR